MSKGGRERPREVSMFRRAWRRFRAWRHRRPFWGGLFVLLAGAEICALPLAPVTVMIAQGIAGVPSVLMGVFLMAIGMITWASPRQHTVTGVLSVLVGLGALVMSNLGGFIIGSLLAFLGGGLMFAWRPTARVRKRRGRRTAVRRARDQAVADHGSEDDEHGEDDEDLDATTAGVIRSGGDPAGDAADDGALSDERAARDEVHRAR